MPPTTAVRFPFRMLLTKKWDFSFPSLCHKSGLSWWKDGSMVKHLLLFQSLVPNMRLIIVHNFSSRKVPCLTCTHTPSHIYRYLKIIKANLLKSLDFLPLWKFHLAHWFEIIYGGMKGQRERGRIKTRPGCLQKLWSSFSALQMTGIKPSLTWSSGEVLKQWQGHVALCKCCPGLLPRTGLLLAQVSNQPHLPLMIFAQSLPTNKTPARITINNVENWLIMISTWFLVRLWINFPSPSLNAFLLA